MINWGKRDLESCLVTCGDMRCQDDNLIVPKAFPHTKVTCRDMDDFLNALPNRERIAYKYKEALRRYHVEGLHGGKDANVVGRQLIVVE